MESVDNKTTITKDNPHKPSLIHHYEPHRQDSLQIYHK